MEHATHFRDGRMNNSPKRYDAFISHAVEDQEAFVRQLASTLAAFGVSVWYSEFALQVGQSLSRSIDRGLSQSQYGIVVVSTHFIAKKWTEYELRGLTYRESVEDRDVILPIWHGVTKEDVVLFSPSLADKMALNTASEEARDIAFKLLRIIRPDIYNKHDRIHLTKLAAGQAVYE